ncbi:MAG: hypothetical protein CW742_13345 [Methanoregula sp.]|nr:MAG: hypothetical protein CW742_13345 [Methanoregula sp.]
MPYRMINHIMRREEAREEDPPLRRYEMPDEQARALPLLPERDTFAVPGERMSADEQESIARPVLMPPLHPSELPHATERIQNSVPDPRLDDPEWGTAKRAPDIPPETKRLLRPWDDEPAP